VLTKNYEIDNCFEIKLIDFGGSTMDYNKIGSTTQKYWNFKI
jgi:hypothetical protein